MEASSANGTAITQSGAAGVMSSSGLTGKRRFEDRATFDKRLRFSVRQTESAYRYRDIVVKKQDDFTHILFSTKTSENNSLNPDVSTNIFHVRNVDLTFDLKCTKIVWTIFKYLDISIIAFYSLKKPQSLN